MLQVTCVSQILTGDQQKSMLGPTVDLGLFRASALVVCRQLNAV